MADMRRSFFTNALRFSMSCDPEKAMLQFGAAVVLVVQIAQLPDCEITKLSQSLSFPRALDARLHRRRSRLHVAASARYRPTCSAGNDARIHPSRKLP